LGSFQAAQAYAKFAGQAAELVEKMPETMPLGSRLASAEVNAVMAEMDTAQHDFAITIFDQPRNFGAYLLRRATTKHGTNTRDNAEGAIEQTAVLHLDEGALMAIEARDACGCLDHTEFAEFRDQSSFVGYDLHDSRQPRDCFRLARRIAAHYNQRCAGVLAC